MHNVFLIKTGSTKVWLFPQIVLQSQMGEGGKVWHVMPWGKKGI